MQNSEKAEDLLSLAMDATQKEMDENPILATGVSGGERWEIIVRYHGYIFQYANELIQVEDLRFGYAIVTLPKSQIKDFIAHDEIEYAEIPKEIYEQDLMANISSCMYARNSDMNGDALDGEGVCIAIIDSGMDVTLPCFLDENENSRVLFFYDQNTDKEYSNEVINEILRKNNEGNNQNINWDATGHGTMVAVIAGGNGKVRGNYSSTSIKDIKLIGAAPKASFLVVRLDTRNQKSFPLTTSLMRAFDYVQRKSEELRMPMVINLSFGNTYGPHDGSTLLERYVNEIAQSGRICICVGAGNEGAKRGHEGGRFDFGEKQKNIFFNIGAYEKNCNLQFWFWGTDQYQIKLIAPNGEQVEVDTKERMGVAGRIRLQDTDVLYYIGTARPYSMMRELFLAFSGDNQINAGTWELRIDAVNIKQGSFHAYLPSSNARSADTVFLQPTPEFTITIPATAEKVISVGAYDTATRAYAEFSGRGYVVTAKDQTIFGVKPEIVAPGVGILTENSEGILRVNGTSFATPIVSGAVARLMQDGIVNGMDPYLYGDKCKAYLAENARELPGRDGGIINDQTGYGRLCLEVL